MHRVSAWIYRLSIEHAMMGHMSALKLALVLLAVVLGVAAVVAGEADDSPGLQGLGVLLAGGAVVYAVRAVRRSRRRPIPPAA
jgi:peptidoglycan/LPS O-acetylase OafA/YrhL